MEWTYTKSVPWIFAALSAVLGAGLWALWKNREDWKAFVRLHAAGWEDFKGLRRFFRFFSAAVALALLGAGALGPRGGRVEEAVERFGVDLFVVLDVSKSMLVEDVLPNRLEAAKRWLKFWAAERTEDRLGLVLFSGDAFLQVPLTFDHDLFLLALEDVDTHLFEEGGSDWAKALRTAFDGLESVLKDERSAAVLFLSDGGVTRSGKDWPKEAQKFQKAGVPVITIGVGTSQGGFIPDGVSFWGETVYKQDASGRPVRSRLEEENLKALAQETQGVFLGQVGEGAAAHLNHFLRKLPPARGARQEETAKRELAPFAALAALFFLWTAWLI